jgi:hypothetical protein
MSTSSAQRQPFHIQRFAHDLVRELATMAPIIPVRFFCSIIAHKPHVFARKNKAKHSRYQTYRISGESVVTLHAQRFTNG